MDQDALRSVAEDLHYLKTQWGPEVPDPEVRRGSAVLRRLLVEDAYGTAWRTVGFKKEPTLVAVNLHNLWAGTPASAVIYSLAGGANYRGIQIAGMVITKGANSIRPPVGSNTLSPDGFPGEAEYALSRFLSSPSGIVDGQFFTRREVIKYIANVKGGVHLGDKQRKAEKKLIDRLGKIEKRINVQTTDGLIVELVAIGQALARSADAASYIARVVPHGI